MRRNAVFEGGQQESELLLGLLFCKAQHLKHLLLNIILMDTDTAAADLRAVQHDIISLCPHSARIRVDVRKILLLGHGERMMHGLVTAFLLGPLQQREIRDPHKPVVRRIQQIHLAGQLHTQSAQHCPHHIIFIGSEQKQVSRLTLHGRRQRRHLLILHKFGKGRFYGSVLLDGHVGQSLGAVILGKGHQLVNFLSGHGALALHVDAPDGAAGFQRSFEYREFTVLHGLRHIRKLHAEPQIRLVGAEPVHGLLPAHPLNGKGYLHVQHLFKQVSQQPLVDIHHIVLIHKGQLHIDLGELRLAVRPQILVPVAAGQLDIPVIAGAHQQLLEQLGRLGQRVEIARMHTAGHQIIPGSFRRTLHQCGRLDLQESFPCHKLAGQGGDLRAHHEISLQIRSSQIQIPVFQAHFLSGLAVLLHREGRCLRLGQNPQGIGPHLHLAGFQVGVHRAGTLLHHAGDGDDKLAAQSGGLLKALLVDASIFKNQLHNPGSVPQIHENDASLISGLLHPSHQGDCFSDVGCGNLRAAAGSLQPFH